MLLLDEPLTGLDVTAATAMRNGAAPRAGARRPASVLVTHDLLDVVTLADHVVVGGGGPGRGVRATATVLAAPRSAFGARFAGSEPGAGPCGDARDADDGWHEVWHGGAADGVRPGDAVVATSGAAASSAAGGVTAG